ncbi:MAG: adenine-specific methyltransferase EcoRI family protein [Bacteroidales bacterium]|nr:adenine-specific methyltransferase EcoRI family protein [Bacteroidales bacterium]
MAGNRSLNAAMKAKQDEFYTQIDDISNELKHYREHFRGKVVFCNCDDPYESNFFKYFAINFNSLGLKKLIATCYDGSPVMGNELLFQFDTPDSEPRKIAYKVEISEVLDYNGDGTVNLSDVAYLLQNDKNVLSRLKGNGDFRSPECVELLKQADIVCTNPPFSLFREYVAQLMKYEKKFLIIGQQNAIHYTDIFREIKTNKLWIGYKFGDMSFQVPDYFEPRATRYWQDTTGQKWRSMGNICWFTNLDIVKRHQKIDLFKSYSSEEYPLYDNYNAINVDRIINIPKDYDGIMGVPITFMDKYNPDQFEIIDTSTTAMPKGAPYVNGKRIYERILIRRKK